MRRILVLAVVALVAIAAVGCPQPEKPPEKPKVTIPKGKVLVSDDVLRTFSDQPGVHMQMARDALQKKDLKTAVQQLRLAAGFMRLELARDTGPGKAALKSSIDDLTKLASGLEGGAAMTTKDMSPVFARAQHALAEHHYYVAAAAVKAKAVKKAQHDLTAATADAEGVFKWVKRTQTTAEKTTLTSTRDLASKIAAGAALDAEATAAALEAFKTHLDNLTDSIEPAPKAATPESETGK